MPQETSGIPESRYYFLERQEIVLNDFAASRLILDLGGGGEGTIGQLKGRQVIAVDPNRRELEEAAEGPLKIIMDAAELLFLDGIFEVVTSFFTLMYIKPGKHQRVFEEVFRVLESNGRFLIWDVDLPQRIVDDKDIVAFYVSVSLPDRQFETGYGTRWPERNLNAAYYKELADRVGFIAASLQENGRVFALELQKPGSPG